MTKNISAQEATKPTKLQPTTMKPRGRGRSTPDGAPRPVDAHVGARMRLRRTLLGMSQTKLGNTIGLTFQQIQKYERGSNRMGASRLFEVSQALDVPVSFFDDMPGAVAGRAGNAPIPAESRRDRVPDALACEIPSQEDRDLSRREILELARAFDKIGDDLVRRRVLELAKALGRAESEA